MKQDKDQQLFETFSIAVRPETWEIGDRFTTPETGATIFTVSAVTNYSVEARDRRSRAGTTSFDKHYITKLKHSS